MKSFRDQKKILLKIISMSRGVYFSEMRWRKKVNSVGKLSWKAYVTNETDQAKCWHFSPFSEVWTLLGLVQIIPREMTSTFAKAADNFLDLAPQKASMGFQSNLQIESFELSKGMKSVFRNHDWNLRSIYIS